MNEQDWNSIIIDLGEQIGQAAIDKSILKTQHRAAINELNSARDDNASLKSRIAELEARTCCESDESEDSE